MSDDAEARAHELLGTVLNDKWTLEGVLGVGGMAAVYSARHRNGARAAVKVLDPQLASVEEVRVRFLREGYAANRVEHPGAVKVLDDDVVTSGPAEGSAYIVMELLDGESLEARAERGDPVGEREFLDIADAVLDVLDAAHSRGVIHRDLKPENLFLPRSGDPKVKVLDFGLARLLETTTATSTRHGLALGTPSFMSPEQAAGRIDEIDGRTDLFALAATGFRLLADRRIHEGSNPVEIVTKMAQIPAPLIRTVAPYVSAPVADIIDRGLEFRREDRYANAAAMRADVKRAIAALDARAPTAPAPFPAITTGTEKTIELSGSDLVAESPVSVRALPPPPAPVLQTSHHASDKPKSRPSLIPLVAVLVFAGIAAKLALDSQAPSTNAPTSSVATPTPTPTPTPTSASIDSARMPLPSKRDDAAPSASVSSSEVPSPDAASFDAPELDAALPRDASNDSATDAPLDAIEVDDDADAPPHPATSGTTPLPPPPRPKLPPPRPKPPPRRRPH